MKIKYLGTGACEGIPSLYCNCFVCKNARQKKGKELRTRSGFVLDDKIVIDFSPDSYTNMVKHDVDFGAIEHILISHTHEDHYCSMDLAQRYIREGMPGVAKTLTVYGNEYVKQCFLVEDYYNDVLLQKKYLAFQTLQKEQSVQIEEYTITPFYTDHVRREDSFVYLIQKGEKAYLHLLDSSEPNERVYKFLIDNQIKVNAVTMDCTFASLETEFYGHMNIWQNIRVKNKFEDLGLTQKDTKYICSHISHYSGVDTHERLSKIAEENGLILAYDGLTVEF